MRRGLFYTAAEMQTRRFAVRGRGSAVSQAFTAASSKFTAFELAADLTYCGFNCDAKFSL